MSFVLDASVTLCWAFANAAYLELAQREDMPLATLDSALQDAAIQAGARLLARAG